MFQINENNIPYPYERFRARLKDGESFAVTGLTTFLRLFLVSKIKKYANQKILLITSTEQAALKYKNDLKTAVDLYTLYKTNKEHAMVQNAIKDDARAKLIKINIFGKDENWDINLQWSDKEKEDLGIKKKDNIMSLDEFNSYIGELVNEIKDYQGIIECLK